MKTAPSNTKNTHSYYIPNRIDVKLTEWADKHLSTADDRAPAAHALIKAVDALAEAKWTPGMKIKASK